MSRGVIHISAPHVRHVESEIFGEAVRLAADVSMTNPNTGVFETRELHYDFERRYEEYLCPERSDTFVMGLMSTGLENGYDIEFEAPMTERLFQQMNDDYIPLMAKYNANFPLYPMKLIGKTTDESLQKVSGGGGAATGCSCGVDSFYTIYTKTRCSVKKYNLTHLLVSSTGFHDTNDDREAIAKEFTKILHRVKSLAQNIGLDTLGCFTNLDTFYKFFQPPYVAFYYFYATNLGSIAFALQKFLDVYYHSSAYSYEDLALHKLMSYGGSLDGSFFDLFALPCMSTQNLTFYSCDSGKTRVEKEAAIADFEPAQKYLSVCSDEQDGGDNHGMNNCSHCEKCLRTMAGFYALGKLDNFSKVFDVQGYKKDLSRRLGWWLGSKNGAFQREFLDYAAQNNVHIPAGVYVWKGIAKFWKAMYKVFGNVRFIRKILYALKLDYLIKGYRSGYAHKKYGV